MNKVRVKNLMDAFKIDFESAKKVDKAMSIIRMNKTDEIMMEQLKIIDSLISGYGIEEITIDLPSYPFVKTKLTYVNMGESYATTIIVMPKTYTPLIRCWGVYCE